MQLNEWKGVGVGCEDGVAREGLCEGGSVTPRHAAGQVSLSIILRQDYFVEAVCVKFETRCFVRQPSFRENVVLRLEQLREALISAPLLFRSLPLAHMTECLKLRHILNF